MIGRNLDQDEHQAVGVGHAELYQAPRFFDGTLNDWNPSGAELSFRLPHVPHVEPELRGGSGWLDLVIGELEVAPAQKEDDPAGLAAAELPHGVKSEDVAVKSHAAFEIARVQHETAGKYLHRVWTWSLHCTVGSAGYIRPASLA